MRLPPAPRRVLLAAALSAVACARHRPAAAARGGGGRGFDAAGHALAGVVRDDRTDAPVAGAFVTLHADSGAAAPALRWAQTDDRGAYRLGGAPAGRYVVRIKRIGYVTEARPVQLGDCGVIVQTARETSHCEDRKHFYVTPMGGRF